MFKKRQVVMLPSNKLKSTFKNQLTLDNEKPPILTLTNNCDVSNLKARDYNVNIIVNEFQHKYLKPQELYILSDDEIKDGDWFIRNNDIYQCFKSHKTDIEFKTSVDSVYCGKNTFWSKEFCKKIIATTDDSLAIYTTLGKGVSVENLPRPSKSFIDKYIQQYNKGNIITDVNVLYEHFDQYGNLIDESFHSNTDDWKLRVNSNNEITIKKVKDNWTRKEVEQIVKILHFRFKSNSTECANWINNNL